MRWLSGSRMTPRQPRIAKKYRRNQCRKKSICGMRMHGEAGNARAEGVQAAKTPRAGRAVHARRPTTRSLEERRQAQRRQAHGRGTKAEERQARGRAAQEAVRIQGAPTH